MADEKTEVENGNSEITKEDVVTAVENIGEQAETARAESLTAVSESQETHEELEQHKDVFKEALDAIDNKFSLMQSAFSELSEKVSGFIESSQKMDKQPETNTEIKKVESELPIIEVKQETAKEEVKPAKRKRFFI